MEDLLGQLTQEFKDGLAAAHGRQEIEALKIKFLGRKGRLNELFKRMSRLSGEEKAAFGKKINELKDSISRELECRQKAPDPAAPGADKSAGFDVFLTAIKPPRGSAHPLSLVIEEICFLFSEMGFKIVEGPEIETEYYNFAALNIPLEHPSREAFDTFYVSPAQDRGPNIPPPRLRENYLLRSHTSPVQVRYMEKNRPPVQIVVPGKVYRPDAADASHSFMFHQIEGLLIDTRVTFAHLKGVLGVFARKLFGERTKMRFRPSFFPFTEPSAEVDISCIICSGSGCSVCGRKGWLEILGAGMVHPEVLKAGKIDAGKFSGFAFGMGVERIAMLKYGIDDIRLFFENDLHFLKQFDC